TTDGTTYLRNLQRLALPITYIHGEHNRCFLPESTQATFDALVAANGASLYRREVVSGYGDLDCIIGKHAARDVYPLILNHLRPPVVAGTDAPSGLATRAPTPMTE